MDSIESLLAADPNLSAAFRRQFPDRTLVVDGVERIACKACFGTRQLPVSDGRMLRCRYCNGTGVKA